MEKNIERFIEKCENDYHDFLKDFAKNFSEEKYNLIAKLREVKPISNEEWDLIQGKYRADLEMARVLITTPFVYSHLKQQVIQDFLDGILTADKYSLKTSFIEDILLHYKNISEVQLENLFYKEHARVTNAIGEYGFDNGIPEKVAKQIMHTELMVLDGKLSKPLHFSPNYKMFAQINSDSLLKLVLDNMPKNNEYEEGIATGIINSPDISDKKKNEIFNMYGCDINELQMVTKEMIEALYLSAVESAIPEDKSIFKHDRMAYNNSRRAGMFIENMINREMLPIELQYDLVCRLVKDGEKHKDRSRDPVIGLITEKTKSAMVLHLIFKTARHTSDRDTACTNPNIAKEDMIEQAQIYYDKIINNFEKEKEVLPKWYEIVADMGMRTQLRRHMYNGLLKTQNYVALESMLFSLYTPEEFYKKAQEIANQKVEEGNKMWRVLQVKSVVKDILKEKGLLTEEYFKAVSATAHSLISQFDKGNFMRNITIASAFYREHPLIAEHLKEICLETANRLEYKDRPKEECLEEMNKFLSAKEHDWVMRDWSIEPPENMKPMQIKRAMNNLMDDFSKLLKDDVSQAYDKLPQIANRYAALEDEHIRKEAKIREYIDSHPELHTR